MNINTKNTPQNDGKLNTGIQFKNLHDQLSSTPQNDS